jgi:hypothetical protein
MTIAISGTNGITLDGQFNSASSMGFKNRILNGGMVIDQRNAGASVTINSPSSTYTLDRWRAFGQTSDGVFTVQQSSTAPSGFINSLLATVTTADASIGSTQFYTIQQAIEGLNLYDLGFGTASAKTVTISFQVRSSVTGTFSGSLKNSDGTRSYPFTYAINAANTWEQKSVTIVGDTSGTWLTTNGTGVTLTISLGSGSSRLATADAWAAGNYDGATGATTLISTNGATFYITGVQLEKGSTATSFDYRPYGTELALCQRYYYPVRGAGQFADVVGTTSTDMFFGATFPVEMRATPTMTGVLTALVVNNFSVAYTASGGSYSFNSTGTQGVSVRKSGFTSLNTSYRYFVNTTSIVVTANAEL